MKKDVIIACDFDSKEKLFAFLASMGELKPFLKVGMELYYKEGADLVLDLKARGYKVFLDLKLHDIPNTVYKAMKVVVRLGADIINVHAAGGVEMMKAAARAVSELEKAEKPLVIAVTQLTSIDAETLKKELLISESLEYTVKKYAENAASAGLSGVVCSPLEAPLIKSMGLVSVTPGIRLSGDAAGDQKRITTPKEAKSLGSDYIVVGRSITGAGDPKAAYLACVKEFLG
ncbi:MAG TPA: orotidine-5'-phosphate decarboxylase [Eubacteriales bacterium]|jgi:orotidine-5'-phosphate decarboxylase|nr:orotidine-5'-phosphate decarboxylase [Clostridia bacterium]HRR89710.1 orotidine-5'-phosphate decarboxylase [Eubacteriales bacterium]HRU84166.1 orotidine-5'-phosphate decarboxylase [Eubacteriales bacterium]